MTTYAIDYAWSHPNPAAIRSAGYVAVLRYFSNDPSKNLTAPEVAALHAAGLGVLAVWETTSTRATEGQAAGEADAQAANAEADAIGYPAGCPLFFAVDESATWGEVAPYFAGAVGASRRAVLPYGDVSVVDGFFGAHGGRGWQTEAWSGSTVSPAAALYQRVMPTLTIPNAQGAYDEDVILDRTLAWWGPGVVSAPVAPAPVPAPAQPGGNDVVLPVLSANANPPAPVLWVKTIQALLKDKFGHPAIVVDGVFGPATQAGVEDVQRFFGVSADGVVGPVTWSVFLGW